MGIFHSQIEIEKLLYQLIVRRLELKRAIRDGREFSYIKPIYLEIKRLNEQYCLLSNGNHINQSKSVSSAENKQKLPAVIYTSPFL